MNLSNATTYQLQVLLNCVVSERMSVELQMFNGDNDFLQTKLDALIGWQTQILFEIGNAKMRETALLN